MAFKPLNTQAEDIKKKEGVPFVGTFKGSDNIVTKIGPQVIWNFVDPKGQPFGIYGFTNLNLAMSKVPLGSLCRVTYKGKQKGVQTKYGIKDVHQALVELDDEAPKDMSGAVIGSKAEDEEPPAPEEVFQ